MEKHDERQQARNLFLQTDMSQSQIAALLNVDRKTIGNWIKQEQWHAMKHAASFAPGAIMFDLLTQLTILNKRINKREPDDRIPTKEEAMVQRRLIMSIKGMNKQQPGNYMQIFNELLHEVNKSGDQKFADRVFAYMDDVIKRRIKKDDSYTNLQLMFFEDEPESTMNTNINPSSLGMTTGHERSSQEEATSPPAASWEIQKNNITPVNQSLEQNISTPTTQKKNVDNGELILNGNQTCPPEFIPNETSGAGEQPKVEGEGPSDNNKDEEDIIAYYNSLGYEKPTGPYAGLYFAQKRFGLVTVRYGRTGRDPDMENYFDNLWSQ